MSIVNTNGTLILFFANIIGKLFGAFYRLPLSNLLGAEGMGLYQLVFPIYSFLLTLITGGISITLTRQIAVLRAKNSEKGIYKKFVIGKNVSLFFGVIFFVLLLLLSYPISLMQGNISAIGGYFAISLGFVFACILGAYKGYYQGFGNMLPTALSQVIEQTFKLVFGLLFAFIFLKQNVLSGVFGALLGISISEIATFVFFLIINKKHVKKFKIKVQKNEYSMFLKQALPVGASYIILPLSSLLDSFLVVNLLKLGGFLTNYATSLYGIETGMILPLINMPNVLISALALACLPDITYKISKNIDVKNQVKKMFKIVLMYITPCAVGLFLLAKPIIGLIFPLLDENMISVATNLLRLSVFEMFFLGFVTISNALLQAFGKFKLPAISLSIGIAIKLILSCILLPNSAVNIYGLVIASVVGYFASCLINVTCIKKLTGFRTNFLETFSPIISSAIMTLIILLLEQFFGLSQNYLGLFVEIMLSVVTYFAVLYAFRQFKFKDIKKALQTKGN